MLFLGMERTSHWAALYFVALMTFGNYVLFNLLVAILVEGFSNQVSLHVLDNSLHHRASRQDEISTRFLSFIQSKLYS